MDDNKKFQLQQAMQMLETINRINKSNNNFIWKWIWSIKSNKTIDTNYNNYMLILIQCAIHIQNIQWQLINYVNLQ